jgi:hypothetical protein
MPALAHAEDEPKPYPECTKTPTDSETAAAKGAFQAGTASFDESDYPRAITYWEDAYRRDCTANLLLKNLARAYELYGQKRQAVVALETFLVREPNSGEKDQIQRRIEVLKNQIASEKATPVAVVATPVATPPAAPVTKPPATTEPEPAPAVRTGKRSVVPLVVAGAGAVVAVVGVAVYAKATSDYNGYLTKCPVLPGTNTHNCTKNGIGDPATQSAANSAKNRRTVGGVVLGVGAAAVAGGLIWYFVQPRSTETTGSLLRPHVDASVTPGFTGMSLSGAF